MITGLLLAAGSSRRMGRPKQLLQWEGRTLLQHAIDGAAATGVDELVVVLGHRGDELAREVTLPPKARIVLNPDHARGQATSLNVGLAEAAAESRAALIFLVDQPTLPRSNALAVIEAWRRTGGRIVRPFHDGKPGHPVLLDRSIWQNLVEIDGDTGARTSIEAHPEWVVPVPLPGPPPPDIDTPEEYDALLARTAAPPADAPAGNASLPLQHNR